MMPKPRGMLQHLIPAQRMAEKLFAMPRGRAVILDTETTGFTGEVIELVVMDLQGHVVYGSRFRPSLPVETGAFRIHGMSQFTLKHEPLWKDEYPTIRSLLEQVDVHLIYNASFDVARIKFTCELYGLAPIAMKPMCLMKMRGGGKLGGQHSALGDCLEAFNILRRISLGLEGKGVLL